jgi:23S rRNA (pseudouridine1915-N3)-methyltransferase
LKITFLWVGRTRDREMAGAMERYLERIRRHAEVSVDVAPEVGDAAQYSLEHRLEREARGILERLPKRGRSLGLDSRGKQLTSEEFARLLETELTAGGGHLHFVLGGPSGLSAGVMERMDQRIALGRMTLPHELARLVLAEQVYRAFSILRGGPYHR